MGSDTPNACPGTRLPPTGTTAATLLAIPGAVVEQYEPQDVLADAIDALDPDLIVATPPNPSRVILPTVTTLTDVPVIDPARSTTHQACPDACVVLTMAPSPDTLPPTPADIVREEVEATEADVDHCYATSNQLELTIDPHKRETRLEGIEAYLESLPDAWHDASAITHLSTSLRAEYRTLYDAGSNVHSIHGAGPPTSTVGAGIDESKRPLIELSLFANGAVTATTHSPEKFGIRGLEGIGPTNAKRLKNNGFTSRNAIAESTPKTLANIDGFGEKTARTLHNSATAIAEKRIVPRDGGTLPSGEPIFIDIETNSLNGEIAWLIGVLDGDSEDGRYLPFRQQTHDDPADHLDGFMSWLTGAADGRPVIAWNGYDFDFEIIDRQLNDHLPEWVDAWDSCYQFDPLYYASKQNYATLPGRSNRLEPVAMALGWEPTTAGIDGARAAAEYNAWRHTADQKEGYQPDWDRLEAYCEDDVRALATIYEALQDASRHAPESTPNQTQSQTTQGSLSDFS